MGSIKKTKKPPRVRKGVFLVVGGQVAAPPLAAPSRARSPVAMLEIDEATIAAFYVNGESIGPGDGPHNTPWNTLDEARAAATAYAHALNVWWEQDHPGETYIDEVPTEDTVHAGVRVGILPFYGDNPPAPPIAAVQIPWGDGTAWCVPP
jgi:hypothetical protein